MGGKRGLVERGLEEILHCMRNTKRRCWHLTWRWDPPSRETWVPRSLCLSKVALVGPPPQCMHVCTILTPYVLDVSFFEKYCCVGVINQCYVGNRIIIPQGKVIPSFYSLRLIYIQIIDLSYFSKYFILG